MDAVETENRWLFMLVSESSPTSDSKVQTVLCGFELVGKSWILLLDRLIQIYNSESSTFK